MKLLSCNEVEALPTEERLAHMKRRLIVTPQTPRYWVRSLTDEECRAVMHRLGDVPFGGWRDTTGDHSYQLEDGAMIAWPNDTVELRTVDADGRSIIDVVVTDRYDEAVEGARFSVRHVDVALLRWTAGGHHLTEAMNRRPTSEVQ